jgi:putative membrane protein
MSDMSGFLGAAYPWVLAAHVTFVIFWVAGLLLVPRYYIHHHETAVGSAEDRAWIERERRARNIILTPSMLITWILGLILAFDLDLWGEAWFTAKLVLVLGLTGYQGWIGTYGKQLAAGKRPGSNRTLRIMNEVPGIVTAIIVVLVIVRPF